MSKPKTPSTGPKPIRARAKVRTHVHREDDPIEIDVSASAGYRTEYTSSASYVSVKLRRSPGFDAVLHLDLADAERLVATVTAAIRQARELPISDWTAEGLRASREAREAEIRDFHLARAGNPPAAAEKPGGIP